MTTTTSSSIAYLTSLQGTSVVYHGARRASRAGLEGGYLMARHARAAVATLAVAALCLAACGDDDDSSSAATTAAAGTIASSGSPSTTAGTASSARGVTDDSIII